MESTREAYALPGLRSPFAKIDRELAGLDGLALSVPVIQHSVVGDAGPGPESSGLVDLVIWGSVIPTLGISNWGREVWLDSGLDPRVPGLTIVQQCATDDPVAGRHPPFRSQDRDPRRP